MKSTNQKRTCVNCQQDFELPHGSVCPDDGGMLAAFHDDAMIGTVLDNRYEILEVLGGGGMGVVYKARHNLMKRIVAIKMLHKHVVGTGDALKRFQLEAQASSCLSLPNILTVYDFGVTPEGQPYMVMDYLDGFSLSDLLAKEGHLSVERSINIFVQACTALAHAHEKGVLHRDLKPSNIMLVNFENQRDFVKIVDFGIAKLLTQKSADAEQLTKTGEVFGSPLYMSPEQCRGKALDVRSDVYSIGCVMYKTLSGLPVFAGDELIELLFHQMSDTPAPFKEACPQLKIPAELEDIVFKALAKEPERRFQTMNELREALRGLQKDINNTAEATLPPILEGLRQNAFMEALNVVTSGSIPSVDSIPPPAPAATSPEVATPPAAPVISPVAPVASAAPVTPVVPAPLPAPAPPSSASTTYAGVPIVHRAPASDSSNLKTIIGLVAGASIILIGTIVFLQNMQNSNKSPFNRSLFSGQLEKARENYQDGKYSQAVSDASDAINEAKKLGPSDPEMGKALEIRGRAYLADQKYNQGEQDFNQAIAQASAIYGDKTLQTAELKTDLASVMLATGRFAQAEPLLQQTLAVQQALKSKDIDIADTYYKLASAHLHLNRLPEAGDECKRALAIEQKLLPANNPKLAATRQLVQSIAKPAQAPEPAKVEVSDKTETETKPEAPAKPEKSPGKPAVREHPIRRAVAVRHPTVVRIRHAYSTYGY